MTFRKPSEELPFAIMVPKPTVNDRGPPYGTIPLVSAPAVGVPTAHAVSYHWEGTKQGGGVLLARGAGWGYQNSNSS